MIYKALITDLDGTAVRLSSNGSDISKETIDSVRQALDDGKIISCATGRGWSYTKAVVQTLGLHHPCVIEGGTRIIDPVSEETLWEKGMSDQAAAGALSTFQRHAPDGLFISSDRDKLSQDENENLGDSQKEKFPFVKDVLNSPTDVRYIYLLGVTNDQANLIVNEINQQDGAVAHMTPSWQGKHLLDIHVTDIEATKEHAIIKWRELLDLEKDEVIGFGDSGNDIPIFEAVGLKVAAESGTIDVREIADYIAPSPEHGGLQHVIQKMLLGQ